jgi:serine/threonine-protein kinase
MKISLKKYILIGISSAVGLFLLAALAGYLYLLSQFSVYQDDQYKFSIKYPKTWRVVVHPRANVAVVFVRPKDTALDVLQENFNVTVQPLPPYLFTLDEFSDRIKAQMIAVFGKGVVEYKSIHWDWRQGYMMSLEAPKLNNLKMVNAWVLRGDQAYILTFLGNIDKYPQDSLVVEEMIRSLHLQ